MSHILPINIGNLLRYQGVESQRVELMASWDPKTTGAQVLKTICAFANDFQNLNGGYLVLGVAESQGKAVLPPRGLSPDELDAALKWIRGQCNRIEPVPAIIPSPELIDGKNILVIQVPGSQIRPHQAPDGEKGNRKYYIRLGSETVDARVGGQLESLLRLTSRVPFDDRRALNARTEDLREIKVREYLRDLDSGLLDEQDSRSLYRKMRIAEPVNGHDVPRNVGLMFFSPSPEDWFPGARIEVVQFNVDETVLDEQKIQGGIHEQLRKCISHLENLSSQHLQKQEHSFRVKGWVSYPIPALREAVVNAIYHRSYETEYQEPTKIYLYSDRIEIISYPGPEPGLQLEHLRPDASIPPLPARNRRIGDFLKELRLAEARGTGIRKVYKSMAANGSPFPVFDFDPQVRSFFKVTLPAHPEFVALNALRDAAYFKAIGNPGAALDLLEQAWGRNQGSATLSSELIKHFGSIGAPGKAVEVYTSFKTQANPGFVPHVTNIMTNILFEAGEKEKAKTLLGELPPILSSTDAIDAAILERRLGRQRQAHGLFEKAGDGLLHDVRALHEFAQTKMALATQIHRSGRKGAGLDKDNYSRLLKEALQLLERVSQLDADPIRHSWALFNLGQVKKWLRRPQSEILDAFDRAIELNPTEDKFRKERMALER